MKKEYTRITGQEFNRKFMQLKKPANEIYGCYNDGINPYLYAAMEFGESISQHIDQRFYNNTVINYLESIGQVIEYKSVAKYLDFYKEKDKEAALAKKKLEKENGGGYNMFDDENKASRLFLCRLGNASDTKFIVQVDAQDEGNNKLIWFYPSSQKLNTSEFERYVVPEDEEKAKISILLKNSQGGIYLKKIPFDAPKIPNNDIELLYGTGFKKSYAKIVDSFENNSKGIVIFRGHSGSGKSTLVKHLTTSISKQFIFVPVNMAGALSEPDFLTLLFTSGRNSIIVLEDAEQAIQSREVNLATAGIVSCILNLADGLLSIANVQFLLTWNTEKEVVDKALTRRGRTLYDCVINNLSIEDAQRLVDYLKKDFKVKKPMPLSDIFNLENDNGVKEEIKPRMGFGVG